MSFSHDPISKSKARMFGNSGLNGTTYTYTIMSFNNKASVMNMCPTLGTLRVLGFSHMH